MFSNQNHNTNDNTFDLLENIMSIISNNNNTEEIVVRRPDEMNDTLDCSKPEIISVSNFSKSNFNNDSNTQSVNTSIYCSTENNNGHNKKDGVYYYRGIPVKEKDEDRVYENDDSYVEEEE